MVQLQPNNDNLVQKITVFFSALLRVVLNALLALLTLAMVVGVAKTGIDLYRLLSEPLEKVIQNILLDTVFIVALLEISIVILGYLRDGRVHVRYIVDTILIIMLNEIVALWFTKPELSQMIGISIVVATLAAIRISVTRFSPRDEASDARDEDAASRFNRKPRLQNAKSDT